MDKIISILNEIGLPYAYDHFSEGESPNPPFMRTAEFTTR